VGSSGGLEAGKGVGVTGAVALGSRLWSSELGVCSGEVVALSSSSRQSTLTALWREVAGGISLFPTSEAMLEEVVESLPSRSLSSPKSCCAPPPCAQRHNITPSHSQFCLLLASFHCQAHKSTPKCISKFTANSALQLWKTHARFRQLLWRSYRSFEAKRQSRSFEFRAPEQGAKESDA
jgi:hypothetical protein